MVQNNSDALSCKNNLLIVHNMIVALISMFIIAKKQHKMFLHNNQNTCTIVCMTTINFEKIEV